MAGRLVGIKFATVNGRLVAISSIAKQAPCPVQLIGYARISPSVHLSKRRNKTAATKFVARALEVNGLPRKIVIDRSGGSTAGINAINRMLKRFGCPIPIEMVRIKHLNNMVEQDHRTIKKQIRPMLGFKCFVSASATMEGIKVANMIRKGQLTPELCPFAQFAALAA